jgi:hypothetical protein
LLMATYATGWLLLAVLLAFKSVEAPPRGAPEGVSGRLTFNQLARAELGG